MIEIASRCLLLQVRYVTGKDNTPSVTQKRFRLQSEPSKAENHREYVSLRARACALEHSETFAIAARNTNQLTLGYDFFTLSHTRE